MKEFVTKLNNGTLVKLKISSNKAIGTFVRAEKQQNGRYTNIERIRSDEKFGEMPDGSWVLIDDSNEERDGKYSVHLTSDGQQYAFSNGINKPVYSTVNTLSGSNQFIQNRVEVLLASRALVRKYRRMQEQVKEEQNKVASEQNGLLML